MANRTGLRRWHTAVVWGLSAVVAVLVVATPARAQMGGEWGQLFDPPVNSRELEQIADTLKLDESQHAMTDDLHSAMAAEFERLSEIMRGIIKQVREEAQQGGGADAWADISPKFEQFAEKGKGLQKQLFEDVKLILTDEQLENWPRAERRWYRGRSMGNRQLGFVSALRADVVLLVDELELNAEQMEIVAPVLDQYEREVDRELHEFEDLAEEQKEAWADIRKNGFLSNMDKMNELFADLRDKLITVRNLNGKYRDQVALRLEGEAYDKFASAYDKAAFPSLYKDSYVDAGVRTVLEMADVTDEQRTEIAGFQERYEAEILALNKKLEKAMLRSDVDVKIQDLMGGAGRGGERSELESEKKKLMHGRYAQLRGLLTEEQAAKLPDPEGEDWRNTDFDF